MWSQLDERDAVFGGDRADELGGRAVDEQGVAAVALDTEGVLVEQPAELLGGGRAHQRDALLVGAEHGVERTRWRAAVRRR